VVQSASPVEPEFEDFYHWLLYRLRREEIGEVDD